MSHPSGSLAFVGSAGRAADGSDRGIVIYRFQSNSSKWKKIGVVKSAIPKFMFFVRDQSGLYVGSEDGKSSMTSYAVMPNTDYILMQRGNELTGQNNLRHIALDADQSFVHAVHNNCVMACGTTVHSTLTRPAVPRNHTHPFATKSNLNGRAFFSITEKNVNSLYEVFPLKLESPDANKRIFIKFKSDEGMANLHVSGSLVNNYYAYLFDLKLSLICTYENVEGKLKLIQRLSIPNQKEKVSESVISDIAAPPGLPYLFVANFNHSSIATCSFNGGHLVPKTSYTFHSRKNPQRLYSTNSFLYVATSRAIAILQINKDTGELTFFEEIANVPSATCMVFI